MPSWPMRRPSKHPHTNTAPGGASLARPARALSTKQKERNRRHETHFLERQRPAGLPAKRLSGDLSDPGRGHLLPAGDQAPAPRRAGRPGPAGVPPVLEQRGEEGLFRGGGVHQGRAPVGDLRPGPGGPRPRGPGDHRRVPRLLPGVLLHPQLPERTAPPGLPHDLGGRFPGLPPEPRREQARHPLRGPERGRHRN